METCRMIHRVSPSCIPLTLLNGILNAIAPFASLLLSSFLLDALFLEKNEQKALVLAGSLLLLSFIMMVLLAYLEKQTTTMKTRLQYEIEETILKHTLDLRYELLEDPATLDHLQQAREGQNGSGGIEWFLHYMQEFIKSSAVIIQSLVILVMMLKKQSVVGNALIQFAHSAYLPVVFIVLFAVVLLCNIALMKRKNEELTHQFYDNVAGNRRFAYYSQICSSDYQVGKDIRLYHMGRHAEPPHQKRSGSVNESVLSLCKAFWGDRRFGTACCTEHESIFCRSRAGALYGKDDHLWGTDALQRCDRAIIKCFAHMAFLDHEHAAACPLFSGVCDLSALAGSAGW